MSSPQRNARRFALPLNSRASDYRFHLSGLLRDHCWHRRMSWPINGMQMCFDCGTRWQYDWAQMRRTARAPQGGEQNDRS